jgi:hypothetical protein
VLRRSSLTTTPPISVCLALSVTVLSSCPTLKPEPLSPRLRLPYIPTHHRREDHALSPCSLLVPPAGVTLRAPSAGQPSLNLAAPQVRFRFSRFREGTAVSRPGGRRAPRGRSLESRRADCVHGDQGFPWLPCSL